MIELKKIDQTCSNIYLIDENECLSKSIDTINANVATLSANLNSLSVNLNDWNSIYTLYTTNSAKILKTILNINTINNSYNIGYNTVQTLSSQWNKEFSLYYPTIQQIDNWYNNGTYSTDILYSWLTNNFPAENYVQDQIINLYVATYQDTPFYFQFSRSYYENCTPQGNGVNITCTTAQDTRYQACTTNSVAIIIDKWFNGLTTRNAYSNCSSTPPSGARARFYCKGYNNKLLSIDTENPDKNLTQYTHSFDRSTCRIIQYKFQNNNSDWGLIS
jgi:hypothetical protein